MEDKEIKTENHKNEEEKFDPDKFEKIVEEQLKKYKEVLEKLSNT